VNLRVTAPLRGQVVDADTGAPVVGATVSRQPVAYCSWIIHGHSESLQAAATRTDGAGRFTVGGGLDVYPCLPAGWNDRLHIVAPGYELRYLGSTRAIEDWLARGALRLTPARTPAARQAAAEAAERALRAGEAGPLWWETVAMLRAQAGPGGPTGPALGRVHEAALEAVVLSAGTGGLPLVLARDRRSGLAFGWRPDGTPEGPQPWPERPGWRALAPEALPPGTVSVECLADGAGGRRLLVARTRGGVVVTLGEPAAAAPVPVDVPAGWLAEPVTACAVTPGAVPWILLALDGRALLELRLGPAAARGAAAPGWPVASGRLLTLPDGVRRGLMGLAADWPAEAAAPTVYAVAGDDAVYRLDLERLPGRRLGPAPVRLPPRGS
jgi:hypothetical protein